MAQEGIAYRHSLLVLANVRCLPIREYFYILDHPYSCND